MTVPTTADPNAVHLGPGILYVAAVTTADPTNVASVTGASSWFEVGYTESGTTVDIKTTITPILVEEEIDPIKYSTTAREASIAFEMAQTTARNLKLAVNLGVGLVNDNTPFEPPVPGAEIRIKIAHLSEEGAIWFARQAVQGGDLKIERKKAPNKAKFPVTFQLEKPAGLAPWKEIPAAGGAA
jgi:hypothetical protein